MLAEYISFSPSTCNNFSFQLMILLADLFRKEKPLGEELHKLPTPRTHWLAFLPTDSDFITFTSNECLWFLLEPCIFYVFTQEHCSWAPEHRLSSCGSWTCESQVVALGMWDHPGTRIRPMLLHWQVDA